MDTGEGAMSISPSKLKTVKQRPPPEWVPFAGSKRKAHIANLGDHYDIDCRPSPAKQFAVDEEVANKILVDGFYFDPAIPPPPAPVKENEENVDADMEDETDPTNRIYAKFPGERKSPDDIFVNRERMQKKAKIEAGKELGCDDDFAVNTPDSKHESQPMSSTSKLDLSVADSMVMSGRTLVISHELQETLARKKLSEDFLPKSLMAGAGVSNNSMSLVLWTPPAKEWNLITEQPQAVKLAKEKIIKGPSSSSYQPSHEKLATSLESPENPFSSIPLAINTSPEPVSPFSEDGESMDID